MKLRATIVALALLVTLSGCNEPPDSGVVVDRKHEPAREEITVPGKGQLPTTIHWPERWRLYIDDGKQFGWVDVSEHAYDLCPIGSTFPNCGWYS